jgi:hypothetical protein
VTAATRLLAADAVLQPPPLSAAWGDLQVEPGAVEEALGLCAGNCRTAFQIAQAVADGHGGNSPETASAASLLRVSRHPCRTQSLIYDAVENQQLLAASASIALSVELAPELPAV